MDFSFEIITLLFSVAFVAGLVDTIAGGGGLLTIPALLYAGIPPATALATNKLQATFGSFTSTWFFIKKKMIKLHEIKLMVVSSFVGSVFGGWTVLQIDSSYLKIIIPVLLIGIGVYFLFSPKIGDVEKEKRISTLSFTFSAVFIIGFYDGFFGPGTGTFLALGFVLLLGYNLTQATAHAKVLNFISNTSALLFFIIYGNIFWIIGFVMALGQILGSLVGSKLVLNHGQKLIRPFIVIISFAVSIKILLE